MARVLKHLKYKCDNTVMPSASHIWASTPHNIRLRGSEEDWYSIIKLLQNYLCSN